MVLQEPQPGLDRLLGYLEGKVRMGLCTRNFEYVFFGGGGDSSASPPFFLEGALSDGFV